MLCSDLLWDAQSVSRKQVPTLQDAFLCCDRETLLSVVEQGYACRLPGWGQATPQQRRVARKRMGRALNAMLDCAVKRKSGKALCIFPEERFIVHARRGQACIERLVQARVVDLSAGAVRQDAAEGACLFGCAPWSQVLSYRVWLEGPWDCCERYMVLASAFWHLTHQTSVSRQGESSLGILGASSESASSKAGPNRCLVAIVRSQAAKARSLRPTPLAGLRRCELRPWACMFPMPWKKRVKNALLPGSIGLIRPVRGIFSTGWKTLWVGFRQHSILQ